MGVPNKAYMMKASLYGVLILLILKNGFFGIIANHLFIYNGASNFYTKNEGFSLLKNKMVSSHTGRNDVCCYSRLSCTIVITYIIA